MMKGLLLLATFLSVIYCHQVLYHHGKYGPAFQDEGRVRDPATRRMDLTFALHVPAERVALLKAQVDSIADPHSPSYGQWMTVDEVASIMRPVSGAKSEVLRWIRSTMKAHSFKEGHHFKLEVLSDHIILRECVVEAANALFQTEMHLYRHQPTGVQLIRAGTQSWIPSEVDEVVDLIVGISDTFINNRVSPKSHSNGASMQWPTLFSSGNLKDLYEVPTANRVCKNTTTSIGFYANQVGKYEYADLYAFNKLEGLPSTNNISFIHGNYAKQKHDFQVDEEVVLDGESLMSMATNANIWFWIEPGWMYEFALDLSTNPHAPDVLSVSYGLSEMDQCTPSSPCPVEGVRYSSQQYVELTNQLFMKVAARGITVIAADGWRGSCGGDASPSPFFPASSPYVTAVGGTKLLYTSTGHCGPSPIRKVLQPSPPVPACSTTSTDCSDLTKPFCEVTISPTFGAIWAPGGGFSQWLDRPSYQDQEVEAYLSSSATKPASTSFNSSGRGLPDIALVGESEMTYTVAGGVNSPSGTSVGTQIFGGLVALLNDQLAQWGKPKLGFLNPLLYQMVRDDPSTVYDVVLGDNNDGGCTDGYYEATKGWDAASGLGVPRIGNMLNYLADLHNVNH